tara:strand:- start:4196 stop:4357 length:162 start_codon:yes stop_codon:yes gene_type:complete
MDFNKQLYEVFLPLHEEHKEENPPDEYMDDHGCPYLVRGGGCSRPSDVKCDGC